jgi:O-antigen ligase
MRPGLVNKALASRDGQGWLRRRPTPTCAAKRAPPERGSWFDGEGEEAIHPKGGNVLQVGGRNAERGRGPSRAGSRDMDVLTPLVPAASGLLAQSTFVERALLWVFIAGLAWCPFWFGSNVLLAWGINAVLFPGLVAIYELALLVRGARHPVAIRQIRLPAALFAGVVLWIFMQNATWTPDWSHHPIWQMTADALDKPVDGSISVNRELTNLALLRLITAASVFWLALQLCRDASRASFLLGSIAAISCAYAAYGLFAFGLTPGRILWFENRHSHGFVTSTFINPDSFAGYAGMGFVLICGLILGLYRHEFTSVGGSIRFRIATFIEVTGRSGVALLGGAFVVLVALLLSGSRGGIAATGAGLVVLGALTFGLRKRQVAEQREAIMVVGALLVAAAFFVFGDLIAGKISQRGFGDASRMAVYMIALRSIFDTPLLGYGYGTFVDVFPMFRDQSVSTWGKWEMAHDTYLEVFQGLGLVFGAMLVASVVVPVWRCVKGATTRQLNETAPCVAASVGFLLGTHALVDLSLQMQAIAVTFMALLGAGVAQSESSRLKLGD